MSNWFRFGLATLPVYLVRLDESPDHKHLLGIVRQKKGALKLQFKDLNHMGLWLEKPILGRFFNANQN